MKKFAVAGLLSICVAAIAVTSGNSQQVGILTASVTDAADTTPVHHTVHHSMHHSMHKKVSKPMKDSTK